VGAVLYFCEEPPLDIVLKNKLELSYFRHSERLTDFEKNKISVYLIIAGLVEVLWYTYLYLIHLPFVDDILFCNSLLVC
jgi:signal-transduction protein with cAMP-binding, CBS, and nucleotidyltransferase domain